jgi:hypothetical protein
VIEAGAELDLLRFLRDAVHDFVEDLLLHEQS